MLRCTKRKDSFGIKDNLGSQSMLFFDDFLVFDSSFCECVDGVLKSVVVLSAVVVVWGNLVHMPLSS